LTTACRSSRPEPAREGSPCATRSPRWKRCTRPSRARSGRTTGSGSTRPARRRIGPDWFHVALLQERVGCSESRADLRKGVQTSTTWCKGLDYSSGMRLLFLASHASNVNREGFKAREVSRFARAAEILLEIAIELEHIAQILGSRETKAAVDVRRHIVVGAPLDPTHW